VFAAVLLQVTVHRSTDVARRTADSPLLSPLLVHSRTSVRWAGDSFQDYSFTCFPTKQCVTFNIPDLTHSLHFWLVHNTSNTSAHIVLWVAVRLSVCKNSRKATQGFRLQLKCDGTRAETTFRLSAKRMSPFKSAGASVQSTTGSRGVHISGSNAGYTMLRGSVKGTGYTLHSPVSPSLSLSCVTVCHHISAGVYWL